MQRPSSSDLSWRLAAIPLAVLVVAALLPGPVAAEVAPRPADEIWVVSTRHLGPQPAKYSRTPHLVASRMAAGRCQPNSMADFFAAAAGDASTVIYIHGNRSSYGRAITEGMTAYYALLRENPDAAPMRYVIFSWPSDQIHGPLRDVRAKAVRADVDAYYLAWLLSQLPQHSRTTLIAYSYGARIACGALHMLDGGTVFLYGPIPQPAVAPRSIHVVLWAPAMHDYWLMTAEHYHGRAPRQMASLLVLYNSCDPVLRHYHILDRCSKPEALGYSGVRGVRKLTERGLPWEQHDVCCHVGASHDWRNYAASGWVMQKTGQYVNSW